ncbi:MAG: hypothetical protein WC969_00870 [Elusimicrobiota bacterium]|jgi:hypothetical protein
MIRRASTGLILSGVLCALPTAGSANAVVASVGRFLNPPVQQFIVPGPMRSCLTPSDPAALIGFKQELVVTLTDVLRPSHRFYRAPLAASLNLEGAREMDRMLFSLMPNAPKIQEQVKAARLSKDEPALLAAIEEAEAEYVRGVKSLAYVVAQAYEKNGLDAGQVRQMRIAMEAYTDHGAFLKETMDLLSGIERAAAAARDEHTLAAAHGHAQALLSTLANDSSFLRPEPLVYGGFANTSLSNFRKELESPADSNAASMRVIENLGPALRKLQPGVGQEVLIAQFAADDYSPQDHDLLGNPAARQDLLNRLKLQIRKKGEKVGIAILFRDELKDANLKAEANEVILNLRHSEDVSPNEFLGMRFSTYRLEVYLVGTQRAKANAVLVPAPIARPLRERLHLDSLKKWGIPVLAALGAANIIVAGFHLVGALPVWSQVLIVAGALLLGAAVLQFLDATQDTNSGRWMRRILLAALVGSGVFALLGFGKRMLVRTAWGALLVAKIASLFA